MFIFNYKNVCVANKYTEFIKIVRHTLGGLVTDDLLDAF